MIFSEADFLLLLACAVACYTDTTEGKIPNGLTIPLALAGLVLNGLVGEGWAFGLIGLVVAFVLHFGLWRLGVVKGGDAKLMIGVGAVVGWKGLIEATLWEFLLLGPVGLVWLLVLGRMSNFVATLNYLAAKAQGADVEEPEDLTLMVFAPIITAAVAMTRLTTWLELV